MKKFDLPAPPSGLYVSDGSPPSKWTCVVTGWNKNTLTGRLLNFDLEQQQIKRISFKGNKEIDTKTLQETIDLAPGQAIDRFRIAIATQSLETLYKDKNFPYAHVEVPPEPLAEHGELVFNITEGPEVRVRKVDFKGRHSFTKGRLLDQIKTRSWLWIFRPGTYDQAERLADMDVNHCDAAINYPNIFPRFAGQGFAERNDKDLALQCLKIYNDWMIDEWCAGAGKGRLIPLTLVPLWDPKLAADEVRRCAAKGSYAIAFSENPAKLGFATMYSGEWDVLFEACVEEILETHGALMDRVTEGIDDPAEVFARAFRLTGRLHRDLAGASQVLLHRGSEMILSDSGLGPRAIRDIRAAQKAGRFTIMDPELALVAAGGAILALGSLLHSQPDRDAAAAADTLTADLLRMLGIDAAEATEICSRPLPDLDTLLG